MVDKYNYFDVTLNNNGLKIIFSYKIQYRLSMKISLFNVEQKMQQVAGRFFRFYYHITEYIHYGISPCFFWKNAFLSISFMRHIRWFLCTFYQNIYMNRLRQVNSSPILTTLSQSVYDTHTHNEDVLSIYILPIQQNLECTLAHDVKKFSLGMNIARK